jgi:shikimate kinase
VWQHRRVTDRPPLSPPTPTPLAPAPPPTLVLLVGMMGSGKSSVGRELARLTRWPFADNDELLVEATGRTARELLAEGGEAILRAGEAAAFRAALVRPIPGIAGVAAGVVMDAGDRAAMARAGFVVWLRARPEALASRAPGGSHRPWLEGDALAWLEATARRRAPLYGEVADLVVDVDAMSPAEVAAEIAAELVARG